MLVNLLIEILTEVINGLHTVSFDANGFQIDFLGCLVLAFDEEAIGAVHQCLGIVTVRFDCMINQTRKIKR